MSSIVIGFDVEQVDMSMQSADGPMDSPWPMFGHDAKRTGRSLNGKDGNSGIIKWKFNINNLISSSPAIDNDGIIYVGGGIIDGSLFAINPDGTEIWRFETDGHIQSSPAIAEDGVIYVGSNDGKLWAVHPDGTEKWRLSLGGGWVKSSPVIDKDGIIYAASVDGRKLVAVYPNGTIKWDFFTNDRIYSSAAIAEDGTIFIGSNDYYMYALNPDGTLKWKFKTQGFIQESAATISEDGTIYFGSWDGSLYALNNNGTLKWKFDTWNPIESSPAISEDNKIYFGSYNGKLYKLNSDGTEEWRYDTGDVISTSPAIDKYGTIYTTSNNGYFYALNPNGSLKWIIRTEGDNSIYSSPAIGGDGTIYFGSWDGYFYALEIVDNNPPNRPSISGPSSGKILTSHRYTISTNDKDGDDYYFLIDWDDDTNYDWIGPYTSGEQISISHIWIEQGGYNIKVKAKDTSGAESDWATLEVTMPRNKPYINLYHWLLDMLDIQRWK